MGARWRRVREAVEIDEERRERGRKESCFVFVTINGRKGGIEGVTASGYGLGHLAPRLRPGKSNRSLRCRGRAREVGKGMEVPVERV